MRMIEREFIEPLIHTEMCDKLIIRFYKVLYIIHG